MSIVEEELGGPLSDIFDRFDYEPIAAASLGSVILDSLECSLNANYSVMRIKLESTRACSLLSSIFSCRPGTSSKIEGTGSCCQSAKAWSEGSF